MEKTVKIGIIGCGGIANGKHMPALAKIKGVQMVAFCDLLIERAEKAAKEYGVTGAKTFTDYRELLKDETIDVIHVCTPNRSHSEITVASLEAGKDVMCEKPMAKTYAEALKMCETAERTGKKLTIGYQNRQTDANLYVKAAADAGEFGNIYYGKALALRRRAVPNWGVFLNEFEQGGGPLIDIGTHALDMTLWVMNNYEPQMVVGQTFRKLYDQPDGNAWGPWDPEKMTVEDAAFGFIKMKNGALINLESSWALNIEPHPEACYMICGDKGGADTMDGNAKLNFVKHGRQIIETPDLSVGGVAFFEGSSSGSPAEVEAQKWIHAVRTGEDTDVLPRQALCVTKILEAIYTSAKSGKPVYFD